MGSDARFLAAAAILHAAALLTAARVRPDGASAPRIREPLRTVDVEVLPTDPTGAFVSATAPAPPTGEPGAATSPPGARSQDPTPRRNERVEGSGAEGPAASATTAPSTPPHEGFDPLPDEGRPGVLGTRGPAAWSIPGALSPGTPAPAPTAPPAPREIDRQRATTLLREGLAAHDKAIGIDLPAAGTVASTVADAVRSTPTPNEARATFVVRLDGSGKVLDVRVASATGGDAGTWAQAARAAAAQLGARTLAMSSAYAAGAVVTVEITSVVQLPSGSKSDRAKRIARERDAPRFDRSTGQATVGRGDLSDIGAHPQRVVSTRFQVQPAR